MIRLIFSAVSTLVLSNNAYIFNSALANLFLSLSPLKISSNFSCTESDIWLKKSNIPSVESVLLFSLDKNASIYLLISSNSRACVALLACVNVKNISSIFSWVLLLHIVSVFLLLTWKIDVKYRGFFIFFDCKYWLLFMCLRFIFMGFVLCFIKIVVQS